MRNYKYEIYEYPDVEEEEKKITDPQHVEKKYLRKRKSVQRKKTYKKEKQEVPVQ